mmetsp:Transcript_3419/g.5268  ORF Transcript_3419/g.5268 Transcript_3419/m.5268 type:complete len:839 (-) Transcript_3419:43-2559(-)
MVTQISSMRQMTTSLQMRCYIFLFLLLHACSNLTNAFTLTRIPSAHNSNNCVTSNRYSVCKLDLARSNDISSFPYSEAAYDPSAAEEYFQNHPLDALGRLLQLSSLTGGFVVSLLLDKVLNRSDDDVITERRAKQLLEVLTDLGPAFIKVGQALSIRTDLLPPIYAKGLAGLQDAVPPFSSVEGRAIIEKELGIRINDVFADFSSEPVASASIGQVYKATLKESGMDVAVKVQRPNVLRDVALDLFLMRRLAPLYLKYNNDSNTDLVGLIDAWGVGFVNELDYEREAEATTAFSVAMKERGLGSVTAPEVMYDFSSKRVLTTRWVDGVRLDASKTNDVPRLCGVALNAYLTMLLDTGTLHCDPHPGNLLRTQDGKLCILDFGMCLDVPQDLQLSLLEFIANLQAENYERVPEDLVKLGFVPPEKLGELRASGMTFGIAQMLRLAGEGGGPKGAMEALVAENKAKYKAEDGSDLPTKERQRRFREDYMKEMAKDAMARENGNNMKVEEGGGSTAVDLTKKIESIQQQNSNVFAIPDYFVYMSRAFATLEGIGLSVDSRYTILKECFPYLAKRLLSDDSPRARGALKTLLYGNGDELNLSKLKDVTEGLESYTTSTTSVESSQGISAEGKNMAGEQIASVILSKEKNYVQSILLREAAVALDAVARNAVSSSAVVAPLRRLQLPPPPPGPLAPLFAPVTLPLEIAKAILELQEIDAIDAKRLENVNVLTDLASKAVNREGRGSEEGSNGDGRIMNISGDREAIESLLRQTSLHRDNIARVGLRFGGEIVNAQIERLKKRGNKDAGGHEISELAERLAKDGASRLELVADALERVDQSYSR